MTITNNNKSSIQGWARLKTLLKSLPLIRTLLQVSKQAIRHILDAEKYFFGNRNAKSFKHLPDYLTIQTIAGYIGFLGYDNLGDEALHLAFRKLFPKFQVLIYDGYNNPKYKNQKNSHPFELILYRRLIKRQKFYDFVFLGGGTLINRDSYLDYFQQAIRQGNQSIVFGTGVCDPSFWKERRQDLDYSQLMTNWIAVLKDAAYVSVRGPHSARILESHGLPKPKVIGDPALSVCTPRSLDFDRKRTLAINLGSHGFIWGSQEHINEVIAKLSRHFLETGWCVEFLPMHPTDLDVGLEIIRKFNLHKVSIWQEFRNIEKTINHIQTYDILVGQRLHSTVLACGCGVPSISLEYQPKCGDFMESIGMQRFSIRTDILELDEVLSLVNEIDMNYVEYCQKLLSICNHYQLLQRQAAQEVINLIMLSG